VAQRNGTSSATARDVTAARSVIRPSDATTSDCCSLRRAATNSERRDLGPVAYAGGMGVTALRNPAAPGRSRATAFTIWVLSDRTTPYGRRGDCAGPVRLVQRRTIGIAPRSAPGRRHSRGCLYPERSTACAESSIPRTGPAAYARSAVAGRAVAARSAQNQALRSWAAALRQAVGFRFHRRHCALEVVSGPGELSGLPRAAQGRRQVLHRVRHSSRPDVPELRRVVRSRGPLLR
jgi:hypothetical protein